MKTLFTVVVLDLLSAQVYIRYLYQLDSHKVGSRHTNTRLQIRDEKIAAAIDIKTSGLLARLQRALSKMAEVWECLLMKLTADQYYFVYFCMLEEPAMFKSLSYSSVFVSKLQCKNIRAGSPGLFMSMAAACAVLFLQRYITPKK